MATTKRAPLRMAWSCAPSDSPPTTSAAGISCLPRKRVVLLHDLHGEFARGHEHERADAGRILLQELFDYGNEEGQRFAGSGLRGSEYIFTFERLRNRSGLHRRRHGKLRRRQLLLHIRR